MVDVFGVMKRNGHLRIICCRFGDKFNQWHVDNLKHMIDEYSGLKYDSFEVIEDDLYGNWFNNCLLYTSDAADE